MNSELVRAVRLSPLAFVVLVATQAACGDNGSTDPTKPNAMVAVSPDSQTTAAGVKMAQPLVVRLTGGGETPIVGQSVSWTIGEGGGSLSDTSSKTDVDGKAQTTYTPGTAPLTANVLAYVGSIRTTFKIVLVAGPPASLQKFGSDSPAAVAGSKLTLAVKLVDAFGNGIADGTVDWAAAGGSISATSGTTDKGGVTSVTYTLGAEPGTYTLTATAQGVPATTFTIKAI